MMVTLPVRFEVAGQWQVVSDVELSPDESTNLVSVIEAYSAVVLDESRCSREQRLENWPSRILESRGSSRANFQVFVLVLVLGSSSPRKFSGIQ